MERLATAKQMRDCDRLAIRELGIPGMVLMENAGRAVAHTVAQYLLHRRDGTVCILCGKGNNGGDGFVAARHLLSRGARVILVLVGSSAQVQGDAKRNLNILRGMMKAAKALPIRLLELKSARTVQQLDIPDVIVDALFGTGFSGKVRKPFKEIIEWINKCNVPVVAVDIPSGLNSDNGTVENIAVRATTTVTMGLTKIGLVVGSGPNYAGTIETERIGIPEEVVHRKNISTYLISTKDVRRCLPQRPLNAHKHSVGKIFVLAGSPGLTGAAAMVSQAAMRSGAGAVVLGTPKSVYPILARKLTEVMVEPLEDGETGALSTRAHPTIEKHMQWSDVVVVGPGLSRHPETQRLIWRIVEESDKRLIIDADGLNALAARISVLKHRKSRDVILTPHTGELSRLTGISAKEIEENRVDVARSTAKKFEVTVILKGAPTVTAATDGDVFINSTGNPGMATAGSGDVLAGIIAALFAQKVLPQEAAYGGVYLHGLAGDLAEALYGERGLVATDILKKIPEAVDIVERDVLRGVTR